MDDLKKIIGWIKIDPLPIIAAVVCATAAGILYFVPYYEICVRECCHVIKIDCVQEKRMIV